MIKEPLVNIVILTTNQFAYVGKCIQSVINANYKNIHIYLVDNNSKKEDYEKFYSKYKHIKKISFFRRKTAPGFGASSNFALKKISRGYVVLLNDDTIVSKNWLGPIINYMEENKDVAACQPKIRYARDRSYFEYAGAGGGFMDVYGYPFCRGRIFYTIEKDRGQYNDIKDVVWVSGNCFVTNVKVLKKVGLLDELFFIYGDEADLCWRMHFLGYRMAYIPKSVVYHYGSGTVGVSPKKIFLHHRNGLLLLFKNYTRSELLRYLPLRILLDFIAFWYYLLDNRLPKHSMAVAKAYIDLLELFPKILERRKNAAFKKNVNTVPYPLYKRSVILDYFIFGKKKYSELSV